MGSGTIQRILTMGTPTHATLGIYNGHDDLSVGSNETVILTIGVPTNATAGTPKVHTVTIAD